jgi:hypothetical protein
MYHAPLWRNRRVLKNPGVLKKAQPTVGLMGFHWVIFGFIVFFIYHHPYDKGEGFRVTYLSNTASSGIWVLQICSRAQFY